MMCEAEEAKRHKKVEGIRQITFYDVGKCLFTENSLFWFSSP